MSEGSWLIYWNDYKKWRYDERESSRKRWVLFPEPEHNRIRPEKSLLYLKMLLRHTYGPLSPAGNLYNTPSFCSVLSLYSGFWVLAHKQQHLGPKIHWTELRELITVSDSEKQSASDPAHSGMKLISVNWPLCSPLVTVSGKRTGFKFQKLRPSCLL